MLHQGDDEIIQLLNLYLENRLTPDKRNEVEYRLKVEPRLAQSLRNVTAIRNLNTLRTAIPKRGRMRTRTSHHQNLWVSDEQEVAYFKAAIVSGNNCWVPRPLETVPQTGFTAFALCTGDVVERVLYVPNTWRDDTGLEIGVVHYGNLPVSAALEVREAGTGSP